MLVALGPKRPVPVRVVLMVLLSDDRSMYRSLGCFHQRRTPRSDTWRYLV